MGEEHADSGRRPAGHDASPPWLVRFRSIRPLTMVAIGRLFLALFALVSVHADPGQPSGDPTSTYGLIAFYIVFGWALLGLSQTRRRLRHTDLAIHLVDVGFIATLIHLTDGVTSPFFVYFTFVLLAAALRWGWRGAAFTTSATLIIYVFLALSGDAELSEHVDRLIVRSSFLVFAGILFSYFAARAEHARLQIARLAAWPAPREDDTTDDPIAPVLAHAAEILRLRCLVVIWREEEGAGLRLACFSEGRTRQDAIETRPAPLREENASLMHPAEVEALSKLVPEALSQIPEDGYWIVAPLPECGGDSRVAMFARRRIGRDFLPLASIVAMRIGNELERHALRRRLIKAAATAERAKLAQDLHDDLLQALTAVTLQLKTIEDQCDNEIAGRIASARKMVSLQQLRLRQLVTPDGDRGADSLSSRLEMLTAILQEQWSCEIKLCQEPEELVLPDHVVRHIMLFVAEAVANGVRHGGATGFFVEVQSATDTLRLSISDDGTGIPGLAGTFGHDEIMRDGLGSHALRRRTQEQGWRIQISVSARGTRVVVAIPLH